MHQRKRKSHTEIRLPACPLPRPGDQVTWFQSARREYGTLTGHTGSAEPIILAPFDREIRPKSFYALRVVDPFKRKGPAWDYLPETALWAPLAAEEQKFAEALGRTIPPGPTYMDLVDEIWHRGFEVFLVGGTVRDVISGYPPNDIDLVTTMPLTLALDVLRPMFKNDKLHINSDTGYCRLGGAPKSGDPFIDLKMVCLDNLGTPNARFGADLRTDVGHRDFACNSLYYDPVNKVILDPHESGLADAEQRKLTLAADLSRKTKIEAAKIAIRFYKFIARGYEPRENVTELVGETCASCIDALGNSQLVAYTRTQILSKYPKDSWEQRLDAFRDAMTGVGHVDVWTTFFDPKKMDILAK